MPYQIATLIWVLLIVSIIISAIATIVAIGYGVDEADFKVFAAGVGTLFLSAIIGWGIWAIYPLTAAGLDV